jgi:hypothetical protein
VICRLPGADLVQAHSNLSLAIEFFFSLARQGAFKSPIEKPPMFEVTPDAPTFLVDIEHEEVRAEGRCGWFNATGLGVLANLVERLLPESADLSITLPFEFDEHSVAVGCYPPRPVVLVFAVDDDSKDDNLEVDLDFINPIGFEQRVRIEETLSDWWCAAALGAFRDSDHSALDSSAVPPQMIDWDGQSMRFTLEKVRASDAMVDALVGIVAWIDSRVAAVARLGLT